jgi:AcrR family transcriptional regulator
MAHPRTSARTRARTATPGGGAPRQERAIATRARLLEAAIDSLVRHGYAGTSTVEVCRRAGASRGAHLHHFPTKAELVAAAVEHLVERRLAEFRKRVRATRDGRRRLETALATMWNIYAGPTLGAWMELVVAARTDPELRRHMAGVDDRFFAHAVAAFYELVGRDDLEPARAAALSRLILSVFDGLALHYVLTRDRKRVEPVLAELQRMLQKALAPK